MGQDPLGVEREGEQQPVDQHAGGHEDQVSGHECPGAEQLWRHHRVPGPGLDAGKGSYQDQGGAQQSQRLQVEPAPLRNLADRIDEQGETARACSGARDHGLGGVCTPPSP